MNNKIVSNQWTNEERGAALDRYAILDTPREKAFDDVVKLTSRLLDAPVAAINLIDRRRQWFKAEVGLGMREMPLEDSICSFALLQEDRMVIPDALADARFNCNPLVTGAPGIRFYAGELLKTPDGLPLGTLCVLDTKPRPQGLTEEQQFALQTLATQIVSQLELRKLIHEQEVLLKEQESTAAALRMERDRSTRLLQGMGEGFVLLDEDFRILEINAGALKTHRLPASEIVGRSHWDVWPGSADLPVAHEYRRALRDGVAVSTEQRYVYPDGRGYWFDIRCYPVADGLAVFFRDISERKRGHALVEGQRKALEMAVTDAPLEDVLDVLVRSSEQQLDHAVLISILLLDDGRLRHGAAPSLPRAYTEAIDGAPIGPVAGSCGTAAYFNKEVIVADIGTDPLWAAYKELALAHGLRSCWSQPIRSPQGKVLGTLACYRPATHVPAAAEKEAVALLVNTAALILDQRHQVEERKLSEDALRRNEQRFRSFVTATSQVNWIADANGAIVEDSPSWRAFTGQTHEEWRDFGWLNALHPQDREATLAAWKRSVERREIFQAEYRVRHVGGSYRWTAVRGVPILNQDGSVREWVGANTDITERKHAEEALHESRERFQKIVVQAGTGVLQTDDAHRIVLVNQKFCDMLGYSEAELLGRSVVDITAPDFRTETVRNVGQAIASGASFVIEKQYSRKDGSAMWATSCVSPLRGPAGAYQGIVAIVIDITGRKKTEAELRKLAAHLAEANQRKIEFLATLAHELRNPLAPIRNGLEVLRLTADKPETAARVQEMMQRQVSHMVHLINDLLDVARINSGKVELRKELVALGSIVANAVESGMPLIEAAHHTLDVNMPDESMLVFVDATRMDSSGIFTSRM